MMLELVKSEEKKHKLFKQSCRFDVTRSPFRASHVGKLTVLEDEVNPISWCWEIRRILIMAEATKPLTQVPEKRGPRIRIARRLRRMRRGLISGLFRDGTNLLWLLNPTKATSLSQKRQNTTIFNHKNMTTDETFGGRWTTGRRQKLRRRIRILPIFCKIFSPRFARRDYTKKVFVKGSGGNIDQHFHANCD